MNRFHWMLKGKHIGRWDDRLILRSVILFILIFGIVGAIFYKADIGWNRQQKIWLLIMAGVVLVLVEVIRLNSGHYKDLYNRQSLARMLLENGWYETEPMQYRKNGGREKITYFPAIYYKRKGCHLYVTVKISMGKYQKQLLHLEEKLESGLDCELIKKDTRNMWGQYEFLTGVEKNRISIEKVKVENGSIPLMKHISWYYDRMPHMLVAGDTGSGKTIYLLTLIERLLCTDAVLYIADPKKADLSYLSRIMPEVWCEKDDILDCIRRFYEGMENRYDEMSVHPDYRMGMNYAKLHLPPHFLIFDEYVAFMEMLTKKEWEEPMSLIKKIVLKGRQAGFFIILACQRPDAKYLGDGVRDQFGFRVALGNMSDSGYSMMFGNLEKEYREKDIKGRGYVNTGNGVVTEFYTPLITDEHDFFGEITKLCQEREERNGSGRDGGGGNLGEKEETEGETVGLTEAVAQEM